MADDAHDASSTTLLIDNDAHGLAIDGETVVGLAVDCIALLQGVAQRLRIDTGEAIANNRLVGDEYAPICGSSRTAHAPWGQGS